MQATRRPRLLVPLVLVVAACQSPAASHTPSAGATPATASASGAAAPGSPGASAPVTPSSPAASELPAGGAELAPGRYTSAELQPRITFAVGTGWISLPTRLGSAEVRRAPAGDEAVALRFLRPAAVYGATGTATPADTVEAAVAGLRAHETLQVVGGSASRMSGLDGVVLELEHPASAVADALVFDIQGRPVQPLDIAPGRALWIALLDTTEGLLAIVVEGSIATWGADLALVEDVLESVTIGL